MSETCTFETVRDCIAIQSKDLWVRDYRNTLCVFTQNLASPDARPGEQAVTGFYLVAAIRGGYIDRKLTRHSLSERTLDNIDQTARLRLDSGLFLTLDHDAGEVLCTRIF